MRPSISVIIPIYNRLAILPQVLESIYAQTLPVLEVILIDDGSPEHRSEDVEQLIQSRPGWQEWIRYERQENQGQSVANNRGIAIARGEWLAFNGNDDLWLPQKLEWQFRALEQYGRECRLCFTDAWYMNNPHMKMTAFQRGERALPGAIGKVDDPVRMVTRQHGVWMQTVIAKADLVREIGGLDPRLRYSDDHDFLFRASLKTKFCYVGMPMVLIDRAPADGRHKGEAKNWHRTEYCLEMDQYRFEKQLRLSDGLSADVRKAIHANLRSNQSHWATCHLINGDYAKARESMRSAASYDLTVGVAVKTALTYAMPKIARSIFFARDSSGPPRYDRTSWRTA